MVHVVGDEDDGDAFGELDALFLKENGPLVAAYRNVNWEDLASLNTLVSAVEAVVVKYKNPNEKIRRALERVMAQLLGKYPLFFGYWKKFTAIEYQLYGLEKSIGVLERAVELFPTSLELWCDYLNVLQANSPEKVDLIRTHFRTATSLVGYQFLSDPFWDKYIAFETGHHEWANVAQIYMEVIKIPLHQYARFSTAFKQLLDSGNIDPKQYKNKNVVSQCLKTTQNLVSLIWPFESKIKQSFFSLTPVAAEEVANWEQYLQFLISRQSELQLPDILVRSCFERCLVPCQYYEQFWLKYVSWSQLDGTLETVIEIFQRGSNVLPTECKKLRLKFLQYLQSHYRENPEYIRDYYTEMMKKCIKLWPTEASLMYDYLVFVKKAYFDFDITQEEKLIVDQQNTFAKLLEDSVTQYLDPEKQVTTVLSNVINDNNFPVVVTELIKTTWMVLKSTIQTIKYFNHYSKHPLVKDSVTFWITYYKFEKSSRNFAKLNKFINDLGRTIFLPNSIINDLLLDYRSFYLISGNVRAYHSSLSGKDVASTDPILDTQLRINKPAWKTGFKGTRLDWHKTREFKENGHPGVSVEKPQIINTIIERSTKSFGNKLPEIPALRNLEKINQAIKYEELDKE